jgi:hypothetical protein
MTSETVTQLGIVGAPVLAPSYIPGAVSFLPSVDAYPGYYSFYWLVPGSPPTYLQVTGTVGGSIPAYSKYDRNVQLTQNATVLGYPAYHDLTPIYDLVYFEIDGVVYSVESNNIGDSSLGIAESLTYVDVPVYEPEVPTEVPTEVTVDESVDTGGPVTEEPATEAETEVPTESESAESEDESVSSEPVIIAPESAFSEETIVISIDGVTAGNLTASGGEFTLTEDTTIDGAAPGSFEWIAPRTINGRTVRFRLIDPATGEELANATTQVDPTPDESIPVTADALNCPTQIAMGSMAGIEIDGTGQLMIDASDGLFPEVGPNVTFADPTGVDGSDILQGVIRSRSSAWVFFEALRATEPYTTYLFLQDWAGNPLLECGIEVVMPEDEPVYPDMGAQDGTGSVAGLGFASIANVPDSTSVNASDMPAVGLNPDGTLIALEQIPLTDAADLGTTTAADPPPAPSDGTTVDDPQPGGTPQP